MLRSALLPSFLSPESIAAATGAILPQSRNAIQRPSHARRRRPRIPNSGHGLLSLNQSRIAILRPLHTSGFHQRSPALGIARFSQIGSAMSILRPPHVRICHPKISNSGYSRVKLDAVRPPPPYTGRCLLQGATA